VRPLAFDPAWLAEPMGECSRSAGAAVRAGRAIQEDGAPGIVENDMQKWKDAVANEDENILV
jgi:hypothetical protein